ncbi:hypothetical protein FKN04_22490 [Bacillus glycinifermentans]|uniref:hypothetical protein n=1 Tax=Bacillus glycinifermentans TaxID=1664069 RepID=UPI0015818B1E|nr:hypothetical protein [Bacillus glycinifermentans]NUJ19304.1 hypothetical protein [Bacillus glycinifermentans]
MSGSKRLKEMKNVWNCTKVHFNPDMFGWIDHLIEYAEKLEVENERLKGEIEKLKVRDEFIAQFCLNGSEFKDRHISDVFNDFMKRFAVAGKGDQNGNP